MRRRKGAPERREEPEEEQPWRDRAVKGGRMGGGGLFRGDGTCRQTECGCERREGRGDAKGLGLGHI